MEHAIKHSTIQRGAVADLDSQFERVLLKERSRAFGIAWRLVGGNRALAEDVLQEAMLKAFQNLSSLKDETRLVPWFFKIVVREAHSQTRRGGIRKRILGMLQLAQPQVHNEVHSDPGLSKRIAQAMSELSEGQREAFVLVHLSGFQLREAAEVLGKAEGTIKTQVHRATKSLQKKLRDIPRE